MDIKSMIIVALVAYIAYNCKQCGLNRDKRVHNFSAGPAAMPNEIMKEAQDDFYSWKGTGMNIMEMSHRDHDGPVQTMMKEAEDNIRTLLKVPANYKILFMHGGAHAQFAAVPLNIMGKKKSADYVVTGYWSDRAMNEGKKQIQTKQIDGFKVNKETGLKELIHPKDWKVSEDAGYVYFCASETIDGLEFLSEDGFENIKVPIVADFTSTLLSRPVDISKYGVIFASAGKNLGPAGVCTVIIREDLISESLRAPHTPSIMSYQAMASSKPIMSIYNTPPTFPLYMQSLMLKHTLNKGGVEYMEDRAIRLQRMIFQQVEESNGFYRSIVDSASRSRMNVPLRIGNPPNRALEDKFVADAKQVKPLGLLQLFGHPVKGGLRVTLYNGIREESVVLAADFMRQFAKEHASEL